MHNIDTVTEIAAEPIPERPAELASRAQQEAADPRYSIYLSASAGTGKTKVLVDRVLRLLLSGTEPKNILCLTYTNAAAYEMQERIKAKLRAWMLMPQEALAHEVSKLTEIESEEITHKARGLYAVLLDNMHELRIQTIHALCAQILRNFYWRDQYLANFTIIEEAQAKPLLAQTMLKLLQDAEALGVQEEIEVLTDQYDWENVTSWLIALLNEGNKLRSFLRQYQDSADLKQRIYSRHNAVPTTSIRSLLITALSELQERLGKLTEISTFLEEQGEKKVSGPLKVWLAQYGKKLYKAEDSGFDSLHLAELMEWWEEYVEIWLNAQGECRKQLVGKKIMEQYSTQSAWLATIQVGVWEVEQQLKAQRAAELNLALLKLAWVAQNLYQQAKGNERWMEYDDLLAITIDLLKDSEQAHNVLYQIDMRLDHVLVDEAQDLSALQWELVKILTDEFFAGLGARENLVRTVFIVGDFKQSIYGFQGASPNEFQKARSWFRKRVMEAMLPWKELDMQVSFRTTAPVLEKVDIVFQELSYNGLGLQEGIEIKHLPYRDGGGIVAHLELVEKEEESDRESAHEWAIPWKKEEHQDSMQIRRQAAILIAETVHEWLKEGRPLLGRSSIIQPNDIMILLKRRGEMAGYLQHEFQMHSIPVCVSDRRDISEHLIVQDLLAIARFGILPQDELNLAGLLKSPWLGLTEEQLYEISVGRNEENLWDTVQRRYPKIALQLQEWSALQMRSSVFEFYQQMIGSSEVIAAWTQSFGETVPYIISQFLAAVLKWEQPVMIGQWRQFIQWLSSGGVDGPNQAANLGEGVRIMTIHAAKGLQAPVVILADAAASEHRVFERILWHYGEEPYLNFASNLIDQATAQVRQWREQEENAERNRLLYVAMTRAEDELYFCGWKNRQTESSWYSMCMMA